MLQSSGHAFGEKCYIHTDYNNQEIFVFELVHLQLDIFNLLLTYNLFHMSVSFGSFF